MPNFIDIFMLMAAMCFDYSTISQIISHYEISVTVTSLTTKIFHLYYSLLVLHDTVY